MTKFLMFGLPRTGSTTLMRALGCHPRVTHINEPFNPSCHSEFAGQVIDTASLSSGLARIWTRYNAIKHVAEPAGWPFDNPALNEQLLTRYRYNVILLTRKNLLRRILSSEIAQQSGVWHRWDASDDVKLSSCAFRPVDVGRLAAQLDTDSRFVADCRARLLSAGVRFLEVTYEDVFGPPDPGIQRRVILDAVMNFVQLPPFGIDVLNSAVTKALTSNRTRSDSPSMYRRIPNVDDVERRLGSDRTGWLFGPHAELRSKDC